MKQYKFKFLIKLITQYMKTVIHSILNAFIIGFSYSYFTASYKILGIKGGDSPEQSRDIINEQLNKAMPNIIVESVTKCLLIMIVLFVPILIYRFNVENKINLIHEFKVYLKEKKAQEKDISKQNPD